jgi:glycosyltransferase involved in cell wall biosynthesis
VRISAVVTTHDVGPWIEEALRSIAGQRLPPDEIVLLDDASSDDTLERVAASGVPVRLLRERFRNAARARNVAVSHCSGAWIAFLDGDDLWRPEHLAEALAMLDAGSDVAFLASYREYFEESATWGDKSPLPVREGPGLDDRDLYRCYVGPNIGWPTSGFVVRRDRFLEVGGFDETQLRRHDADLFLRLAAGRSWAYQPRPTWVYRKRETGNISAHRAECAYYLLRSMLKLRTLYAGPEMEARIQRQARLAFGAALRSGEGPLLERVAGLGSAYLGLPRRLVLAAHRVVPGAVERLWRGGAQTDAGTP